MPINEDDYYPSDFFEAVTFEDNLRKIFGKDPIEINIEKIEKRISDLEFLVKLLKIIYIAKDIRSEIVEIRKDVSIMMKQ